MIHVHVSEVGPDGASGEGVSESRELLGECLAWLGNEIISWEAEHDPTNGIVFDVTIEVRPD